MRNFCKLISSFFIFFFVFLSFVNSTLALENKNICEKKYLIEAAPAFYALSQDETKAPTRYFDNLDSDIYPFVNTNLISELLNNLDIYFKSVSSWGYTHVVIDDIAHFTYFDLNSDHAKRVLIYEDLLNQIIALGEKYNLKIIISSDFPFYSPEISKFKDNDLVYFDYQSIENLFINFPKLDGIQIRVGEGGNAYNNPFGYGSHVSYTKISEVNNLLKDLDQISQKYNKNVYFRTWTIGIGEVGDLLTGKKTYEKVFENTSQNVTAVIKHTPSDFFRFGNQNPNLGIGNNCQIVEVQVNREYEGRSIVTNNIKTEINDLLTEFSKNNIYGGVSVWSQIGGWGGGNSIFLFRGFFGWNEPQVALFPQMPMNNEDINQFINSWYQEIDPSNNLSQILLLSDTWIKKGLYFNKSYEKIVKPGEISVPTLGYVWWDELVGSVPQIGLFLSKLSTDVNTEIQNSNLVVFEIDQAIKNLTKQNSANLSEFIKSLEFQKNLYSFLGNYRAFILKIYKSPWSIAYFSEYKNNFGKELNFYNSLIDNNTFKKYKTEEISLMYSHFVNMPYLVIFATLITLISVYFVKKKNSRLPTLVFMTYFYLWLSLGGYFFPIKSLTFILAFCVFVWLTDRYFYKKGEYVSFSTSKNYLFFYWFVFSFMGPFFASFVFINYLRFILIIFALIFLSSVIFENKIINSLNKTILLIISIFIPMLFVVLLFEADFPLALISYANTTGTGLTHIVMGFVLNFVTNILSKYWSAILLLFVFLYFRFFVSKSD